MTTRPARAITATELPAPAYALPDPEPNDAYDRAITPRAIAEPELRPIPWSALFVTELGNALTLRLSRISLILGAAIGLISLVAIVILEMTTDPVPAMLTDPQVIRTAATGAALLLLPLAAISLLTTEWSDRSIAARFLAAPNRNRILIAKIITSLMLTTAIVILLTLGYLATGRLVAGPDAMGILLAQIPQTILPVLGATLWAAAIAALIRRIAGAVVVYGIVAFVVPSVALAVQAVGLAQRWPWLVQIIEIFDINATIANWSAFQPTAPAWVGPLSVLMMVVIPLGLAAWGWRRADL